MRAAVIAGPRRVGVADVEVPEPGLGEVLVRMTGSGICGSEIPAYEGRDWFEYPLAPGMPGHEGWGVIEKLGDGVKGPPVGAPVALLSERAHAEYDVAAAEACVPVPASAGDDPFPGEALGCVMNIFERSGIRVGDTVGIVGIGFLGALLTQLAAAAGASVVAISRRAASLGVAERMGAETLLSGDDDVVAAVERITEGRLCDRVLECTGAQGPLDIAAAITRIKGRLVIAGYHQDGPRTVDMQMWNWRGFDVINAHERDPAAYVRGIMDAADAIEEGRLDPSPLYTHRFPLEDAGAAFAVAAERPPGFVKAVVMS